MPFCLCAWSLQAYSAAVQSQLQWMKQLCLCVEQHVKENTAYFQVPGLCVCVCVCVHARVCVHVKEHQRGWICFLQRGYLFFIQARDCKCDCLCWHVPASLHTDWVRLKTHLRQRTFTAQTTTPKVSCLEQQPLVSWRDSGLVVWARLS